jgi:hypothetical protein
MKYRSNQSASTQCKSSSKSDPAPVFNSVWSFAVTAIGKSKHANAPSRKTYRLTPSRRDIYPQQAVSHDYHSSVCADHGSN